MQDSFIFKAAILMPPHERAAYLDRACGVDAALRLEVEALLRAHEQPGEFMFRPPIADMATDYRPGPDRPGTRIGPYKLLQYLGEGGMGTVFLAEQSQPVRRMVALKIIKPGMDSSQILARFEAERQALAIMDHPNIAKVYDAGTTQTGLELPPKPQNGTKADAQHGAPKDEANNKPTHTHNGPSKGATESIPVGRPYFVMELVKGVPITEFCDKNKLNTRQRLELFVPVCNAIQHAHMKGIIHRDIKPSNVLIALYDGKPVPKVIDFGVAKAMSEPLTQRTMFTQIGQIVGTFEYMSPEQATLNQLDIDTRSDIYSLGVLLYELLTGMTPLNKDKLRTLALDQMLKTIREEEPVRPSVKLSSEAGALAVAAAYRNVPSSKLTGMLRGELDWIVMKCLEKERNRRFVTAGSLAEDIERYLRDEPVTACPPSLAYRAQKAYRKNKLAIFVTSLIGAVLLVATAISILFAINANRARLQAEAAEGEISKKHEVAEKAKSDAEAERDKNAVMVKKLSTTEEERRRNQYAWDFQIMQTAYDTGRIGQVQQMLARHAEDLRGFEWYYWNKQIHSEQRTLKLNNDKSVGIRDSSRGPGGATDTTQWVMNELGTRAACVSYELQGEEQTDPVTKVPIQPRNYFIDVFDCADGRRLCHHKLSNKPGSTTLPRMSHLVFNRDGSRLVVGWTYAQPITPPQPEKLTPRNTVESLFKVIDVATGNSIYDVNLGTNPSGLGGFGGVQTPLFFPDGKRLALVVTSLSRAAITEGEKTAPILPTSHVRIIDLQTQPGKEIGRFETSNNSILMMAVRGGSVLAISPDGSRIVHLKDVTTDASATKKSYCLATVDASTGKELHSWPIAEELQRPMIAFSPDSRRLAFARMNIDRPDNNTMIIKMSISMHEADTGKELYKEVTRQQNQAPPPAGGAMFSPDGKILYLRSGTYNAGVLGRAWAFHADTGKPLAGYDGDSGLGQCVFSPTDSTRLYHVEANAVVIRDALTGKALQTLRSHVQNITYLGMAADGRTISTLDNTGEYKVWNTAPARPIVLRGLPSNTGVINVSANSRLSPDGHYVVGVPESEDKANPPDNDQFSRVREDITRLALWDATNGRMQHLALRPMSERPKETNFRNTSTTSNLLQFTSNSRFVSLMRYRNYRDRGFGPDGSGTKDQQKPDELDRYNFRDLTVWDTATGQETAYLQLPVVLGFVNSYFWLTPDGKTAVISNTGMSLTAYDLVSGRELWTKNPAEKGERSLTANGISQAMSPDGKVVLRFLRVYEVDAAGRVGRAVNNNMKYEVIETATGRLIRSFEKPYEAFSSSLWSPDGKSIALITNRGFGPGRSGNKLLRVIHIETGEEVMSLDAPPGSTATLQQAVFSPDGRRIVARMSDRNIVMGASRSSIRIWDAATGNELLALPADRLTAVDAFGATTQLALSADGYRIVEFLAKPSNRASTAANPVYCAVRFIDATPVK